MKKLLPVILIVIFAAVGVALFIKGSSAMYKSLGFAIGILILFIGSALLLFKGMTGFSSRLKYALLSYFVGYSLFGVTQMILPLLVASKQLDKQWLNVLFVLPPFVVAMIVLLRGTFNLRKLFDVHSLTPAWWLESGPPLVFTALFIILPYPHRHMPEAVYIILLLFLFWNAHILLFSAIFLARIKRVLGVLYSEGLAWLILAVTTMSIVTYSYIISEVLAGGQHQTIVPIAPLVCMAIAGLLLVRSAYALTVMASRVDLSEPSVARNFFGKPLTASRHNALSSIDIVMYAANLASDPHEIDPLLEKVRLITSRASSDLSKTDQESLKTTYLGIEKYLTHEEKGRIFTAQQLREEVSQKLHITLSSTQTFWHQLPPPRTF